MCPGFINILSHSPLSVLHDPRVDLAACLDPAWQRKLEDLNVVTAAVAFPELADAVGIVVALDQVPEAAAEPCREVAQARAHLQERTAYIGRRQIKLVCAVSPAVSAAQVVLNRRRAGGRLDQRCGAVRHGTALLTRHSADPPWSVRYPAGPDRADRDSSSVVFPPPGIRQPGQPDPGSPRPVGSAGRTMVAPGTGPATRAVGRPASVASPERSADMSAASRSGPVCPARTRSRGPPGSAAGRPTAGPVPPRPRAWKAGHRGRPAPSGTGCCREHRPQPLTPARSAAVPLGSAKATSLREPPATPSCPGDGGSRGPAWATPVPQVSPQCHANSATPPRKCESRGQQEAEEIRVQLRTELDDRHAHRSGEHSADQSA